MLRAIVNCGIDLDPIDFKSALNSPSWRYDKSLRSTVARRIIKTRKGGLSSLRKMATSTNELNFLSSRILHLKRFASCTYLWHYWHLQIMPFEILQMFGSIFGSSQRLKKLSDFSRCVCLSILCKKWNQTLVKRLWLIVLQIQKR